mmetsp:Transcript_106309/g.300782  ORF Transcript_106309/g.300782 Transcript_106309/m.300782 type:complete len:254 (+) Transcript_106309:169-930(+)
MCFTPAAGSDATGRAVLAREPSHATCGPAGDRAAGAGWHGAGTVVLQCLIDALGERIAAEMSAAPSVFNSITVPRISLQCYLERLYGMINCSSTMFLCALILVDRYLGKSENHLGQQRVLSKQNVHRLFLTCLVVMVKYNEDSYESNAHFANAGGIHLGEMNRLELSLLTELNYDLRVQEGVYRHYEQNLGLFTSQSVLELPTVAQSGMVMFTKRCIAKALNMAIPGCLPVLDATGRQGSAARVPRTVAQKSR